MDRKTITPKMLAFGLVASLAAICVLYFAVRALDPKVPYPFVLVNESMNSVEFQITVSNEMSVIRVEKRVPVASKRDTVIKLKCPKEFWLEVKTDKGGYVSTTVDEYTHLSPRHFEFVYTCLLYTSPSPRDATLSRMPSSA